MIIKIDKNTFIKFDEKTKVSRTIFKGELEDAVDVFSKIPSDEELLAWAKENYPRIKEDAKELEQIKEELAQISDAVDANLVG